MSDHSAEHKHYACEACHTVFCDEDPRFANMMEGDGCPECHVATVTLLPLAVASDDPFAPMSDIMESFGQQQVWAQRIRALLEAATRLYPHLSISYPTPQEAGAVAVGATITEGDVSRGLRAVEVAFGMEAAILTRLKQEVAQAHGA
jgi:hypothetical protein